VADEKLLSLRQASERCGVSTSRLRRLAATHVLGARKVGAYWVVSESALEEFIRLERPRGVRADARAETADAHSK
jgi:excisionase family DNA binding protein